MNAARDFIEVFLKVASVIFLPLFIIGYGLYGVRVWLWNVANQSAFDGDYHWKIQQEDKNA
jgi:hypothetical protein